MLVGSIQATTELTSHRVGAATVHVELIWASLVKQAKKEKKLKFLCSTKSERYTKKNLKDHVKQSGNTSLLRVEGKKTKTQQYNLLSHQPQHHCQKQMGKEIKDKLQISWALKQCNCSHN